LRVFAVSDIHIDYEENNRWLHNLSQNDYTHDILILAGDVTDITPSLVNAFKALKKRFLAVVFVPGNHDLWVTRNSETNSLERFRFIKEIAHDCGIFIKTVHFGPLSIVPLLGWYDYSFGRPATEIINTWMDYSSCKWPDGFDDAGITDYFISMNEGLLNIKNDFIISFSHFLPRIDIMPSFIPPAKRLLYPVLGSSLIERQIRKLNSNIHIYGHSHVNNRVFKDNTLYINNAFGYPHEVRITSKQLLCVFEV